MFVCIYRVRDTKALYAVTAAERMTRLCWVLVMTCFYSISEGTIIIKEPGENITLKCSSEGCLQSNIIYAGMYLYHELTEQNEVYYYSNYINNKITVRQKYKGRIWTNGTPASHDITIIITSLTVDDSGVYTCVYKESVDTSVKCDVYTVFVRVREPYPRRGALQTTVEERRQPGGNHNPTEHHKGSAPCSKQKALLSSAEEEHLPLLLIIGICAISTLFIIIFIVLIIQRVKQRSNCKRKARNSLQESNDFVYEVMMKTNVCPTAAPEHSSQNTYEFD